MEHNNDPVAEPAEESIFHEADFSMQGYDKHIRRARNILFIIAGLQLIGIFTALKLPEPGIWIAIGIYVFFAAVFAGLGFWTRKKPYTAILVALIVYISLLVLGGILEPASIAQGLILKIVIVVLLIMGLQNGKDAQQQMEDFKQGY